MDRAPPPAARADAHVALASAPRPEHTKAQPRRPEHTKELRGPDTPGVAPKAGRAHLTFGWSAAAWQLTVSRNGVRWAGVSFCC